MEDTVEQKPNSHPSDEKPWLFKPGQSGNPAGRPKGETLKEFARRYYMSMTEEEKKAYIAVVESKRPGFAWEMGEGKAKQDVEVSGEMTSKVVRLDE